MKRRIAAIMVGDVVGYSSMMEKSEELTAERVGKCQSLIAEKVEFLDGRIFNTVGDAALAEFQSAINALRCAVEIRSALAGAIAVEREPLKMRFGLNLADVIVQGNNLVGDGVNLAARIQQAAEPDAIDVSAMLFENVRRNSPFVFDNLGERTFKNISEPVRVYRVRGEMGPHRLQTAPTRLVSVGENRPFSIAVLPFRASGNDEEQRFLAEGLSDELILELGRFRRLLVSSRSASFAMEEPRPDPVKVGERLSVRYVLYGQVRKFGDSVRVGLTLSDSETGSVVWTDKIMRPFAEISELIDDTAGKIAATVFGRIEDANLIALRRKQPQNMTAFEHLLRGIDHHRLGGVTDDNAREAVKCFAKAIEADPNYAAAYAWRVCAASWLSDFDLDEGERDIRRALELDPCDPEANRILGWFELMKGNFDDAEAHTLRSMELNPSDAYIKARCANVSTYVGLADRSLALLDQAEALDPFLPVWCIEERGIALYALERYQEALDALAKLVFQTYRSRLYRAAALVALDRPVEARRLVSEANAGNPGLTASKFMSKELYRDQEKRRELRRRLLVAGLPE